MNRAFIFNGNNEDRSDYLTRMAQVIDSIRTGSIIHEIGDSYKNILTEDEQKGARKTLQAAALTYVAATATALAQLLRLLILFGNRNNRDRR